ncbi:protein LOL2 [Arachis duranensis]|uniref:Zinc finger LSD1-type domain-containing protein n=2 Tax=Arachis TaxID=3817 RepID=A0A445DR46_ARAHY|nr:protein LOL2 [Arachis duranensis]RYR65647.1 hypothetical protein Ahy_A03g011574 isoform B [Arachis hypogaea]
MMQIDEIKTQQVVGEDDDGPPPGWQPIHTPPPQPPPQSQSRSRSPPRCPSTDQVGQVKCGGCAVLLMYPYGAPQVRCSSCRFVTEIGAHNKRPPWSEQQRKPTLPKTAC